MVPVPLSWKREITFRTVDPALFFLWSPGSSSVGQLFEDTSVVIGAHECDFQFCYFPHVSIHGFSDLGSDFIICGEVPE